MEELTIRQRNRLKHHYTMTSNVVLMGYRQLTDAEKITYQVIDSFDWSDTAGARKGYAFPSLSTLARLRGVDVRTIRRHIAALEAAGLMTRQPRRGQPSLLWIEDPSERELERYLSLLPDTPDTGARPTPDTNVRPAKEEDKSETDKSVNAGLVSRTPRRIERPIRNHASHQARGEALAKREYYAGEMLNVLGDQKSLGCYRRIAEECPPEVVFEALSIVKDATNRGAVKRTKGAMFVDLVERLSMQRGLDLGLVKRQPLPQQDVGPPTARST